MERVASGPRREKSLFTPMFRAVGQLDDPRFVGVVLLSLLWSVLCFAGLAVLCAWGAAALARDPGWLGWVAGVAGATGAVLVSLWLFVPVALVIATFYVERIAAAVDARDYPGLPLPRGASWTAQGWDGILLGLQVLALQVMLLVLAFAVPGIGWVVGVLAAGWAIGRGLFVAVAMRRMNRLAATRLYARRRARVLVQGVILALAATIPLLNLLVPVLGVAAMVHVLNRSD